MALFSSGPTLAADEKARVEYHVQQIIDCIGGDRSQLPILSTATLLGMTQNFRSPKEIMQLLGEHLHHPTGDIRVQVIPELLKKVGGGG